MRKPARAEKDILADELGDILTEIRNRSVRVVEQTLRRGEQPACRGFLHPDDTRIFQRLGGNEFPQPVRLERPYAHGGLTDIYFSAGLRALRSFRSRHVENLEEASIPDQNGVRGYKDGSVAAGEHLPHVSQFAGRFRQARHERMVGGQAPFGLFKVSDLVKGSHPEPAVRAERQPAHRVAPGNGIFCPALPIVGEDPVAAKIKDAVLVLNGRPAIASDTRVPCRESSHQGAPFLGAAHQRKHQSRKSKTLSKSIYSHAIRY